VRSKVSRCIVAVDVDIVVVDHNEVDLRGFHGSEGGM
jgi:hypothetical protein